MRSYTDLARVEDQLIDDILYLYDQEAVSLNIYHRLHGSFPLCVTFVDFELCTYEFIIDQITSLKHEADNHETP